MSLSTSLVRRLQYLPRVTVALGVLAAAPAVAQSVAPKVAAPTAARQLQFIPNRNQWAKPVLFATDVPGGRLFLERGRLMQALYDTKAVEELHHHKPDGKDHRIKAHAYSVTFVGANQQAAVKGGKETGEINNYFLGKDQSKWASNVPSHEEVRYQDLYPGTNLRFYTNNEQLEYDFELAPGADVSRIKLRYEGQQKLSIVKGALQIQTSVGTVVEQSPVAYQLVNGQKVNVPCQYALSKDNTLSFAFPRDYNHAQPLVIDPVLVYSSYTGSTASNWGYTAKYDAQGNLYSGGIVQNTGYPVTTGAYDISYNSAWDYGIIKYNPAATTRQASRVYATYIGGNSDDHPHSMVVDPAGNLLILGTTNSSDFPTTTGAYDRTFNTGTDIVVSKLNATGSQLLASTFFGGNGVDGQLNNTLDQNYNDTYRGDITTDAQGNIYLATMTASANFPAVNGFQSTKSGNTDAVVAKFNSGLTGLTWSNFLGGSGEDAAYSVQVDSLGTVFVSGGTTSTNFPGTVGGLNPQYRGATDGWVARISPAGNDLFQSTYVGTTAYDQSYFVQLDRQGNVYLFGQTEGNYPVTPGVYSNPGSTQFIHKINRQLTATLFSTVIGNGTSTRNISPTAFLVDNCGQILLSGFGGSIANMPITSNAIQTTASGASGSTFSTSGYFYIMQLSANAGGLVYGTYFGNASCHVDGGTSRFDKKGVIYQSMCVGSGSVQLPITPNGWSATNGSSYNNVAFKIDVVQLDPSFTPSNLPGGARLRSGCAPLTVFFTRPSAGGTTTTWNFGNGLTSSAATPFVSTTYTAPGRYIVRLTLTDPANCVQTATATDTIVVYGLPRAAAGPDKTVCEGGSVTLTVPDAGPGVTYSWFPPTGLNTTTGRTVIASPTATTFYILTANNITGGCTAKDTVVVNVATRPQVTASASTPNELTGAAVNFTASATGGTVASYTWDFGDGTTGTGATASHVYERAEPNGTNYTVRLTAKYGPDGSCEEVRTITVFVRSQQKPNVITPNGDGKNDTFRPFLTFQPVNIQIFNRWGKKVFEQSNYTDGWGKNNVPGGVYYYLLESSTGETWKGWVEVVR